MHVVVPFGQHRIGQRSKSLELITAEMIGGDHIQRAAGLGLVVVVPARIVPTAAGRYLIRGQAEQKEIFLGGFFGHLYSGAVAGADRHRP
jgi:hypothetical protein